MDKRIDGRVVLVAGGTGGLGRAVSVAFLNEGATVVVTYRREEELVALKAAAGTSAERIDGRTADVTDEASVRALVEAVVKDHGRLDVVVNTVGGFAGGKKLWEADAAELERMLALNLRSGWAIARAAVPAMLARGSGAIVNVAATAAEDHPGSLGAYAGSKAAAVAMIASLAADLRGTRRTRELDPAEHHRHRGEPESDAGRGSREVAEAGGDRARRPLPRERRREARVGRGREGVGWLFFLECGCLRPFSLPSR